MKTLNIIEVKRTLLEITMLTKDIEIMLEVEKSSGLTTEQRTNLKLKELALLHYSETLTELVEESAGYSNVHHLF